MYPFQRFQTLPRVDERSEAREKEYGDEANQVMTTQGVEEALGINESELPAVGCLRELVIDQPYLAKKIAEMAQEGRDEEEQLRIIQAGMGVASLIATQMTLEK